MERHIGHYSFVVGVVLALVLGAAAVWGFLGETAIDWLTSVLVVLGLIVGLLNVSKSESTEFALLATVLVIAAGMGSARDTLASVGVIGAVFSSIFVQLLAFVVPATIVVALKGVLSLAQVEGMSVLPGKKRRR